MPSKDSASPKFKAGEIIDYYSASLGTWIPARVVSTKPDGTCRLDCKDMDVLPEKLRPRSHSPGLLHESAFPDVKTCPYPSGEMVEYYSSSANAWILAKVLRRSHGGTYDLDCKPAVSPKSIRALSRAASVGVQPVNIPASLLQKTLCLTPSLNPASIAFSQGGGFEKPRDPVEEPETPCTPAFGHTPTMWDGDQSFAPQVSGGPSLEGKPLQLVRIRAEAGRWRYTLCPEAMQALASQGKRPISVKSICGASLTGKSFLLNMLTSSKEGGPPIFEVGNTTKSCTEGLWVCSFATSSDARFVQDGSEVLQAPLRAFIDCEGCCGTGGDQERDAHLIMLCIMLSSSLLVNVRGVLNEPFFTTLGMACRCADHAKKRVVGLNQPSLLVVIRDFVLELVSATGCPLTPNDYLEQMLSSVPVAGHRTEVGRYGLENRKFLMDTFPNRHCVTLIRPVVDESQLGSVGSLPPGVLRQDFTKGIEAVRAQLAEDARSHQPLDCSMFLARLRCLVALLNSNDCPMKSARRIVETSALVEQALLAETHQMIETYSSTPTSTGGTSLVSL